MYTNFILYLGGFEALIKKNKAQLTKEQQELDKQEAHVTFNEDVRSMAVNLDQEQEDQGSIVNIEDYICKKKRVSFPDGRANQMPNDSDEDTSNVPLATILNSDTSQVDDVAQQYGELIDQQAKDLKNQASRQMQKIKQQHYDEIQRLKN